MNYKEIMDTSEQIEFSILYEKALNNIGKNLYLNENLLQELSKKRKFGLEKYKEYSFQSSLKNCLTSPTLDHALEEIIDLLNYLLHEYYKNTLCGDIDTIKKIVKIINDTIIIYSSINDLKNHI